MPIPLKSDRSAWDMSHADKHASDIESGAYKFHVPKPFGPNLSIKSNENSEWVLTSASSSGEIIFEELTPGRVPFVSSEKKLTDANNFTFDGASLHVQSLNLSNTLSDMTGVIFKGTTRFIHNFQHPTGATAVPLGGNLFMGLDAGNFTTGQNAFQQIHASFNTGVGSAALKSNDNGYSNVAVGARALTENTDGKFNVGVGVDSLRDNTDGEGNTVVGFEGMMFNTFGSFNVAIGEKAGKLASGYNTPNDGTDNSIYIGAFSRAYEPGVINEIVIGYEAEGYGSYTAVLGNNLITRTILRPTTEWRDMSDTLVASVDTSGIITAAGYKVGNATGWSGTFLSGNGETVTVTGGLIISVV